MARYREKPQPIKPEVVEAIEWTGSNTKEIKEFLGNCFVEVENNKVWYKMYKDCDFVEWITPGDVLYLDECSNFYNASKKNFLQDWELIEEQHMEKEFSAGFYHDLADILEVCKDNNINNCDIRFKIHEKTLVVNFAFSVIEEQEGE